MADYEMFDVCEVGEVTIVRLRASELDETKLQRLNREWGRLAEEPGRQRLVIDLETVGFLTSTGIGALIALKKKIQAGSGILKLCGLHPDIRSLFAITQVDRLFDIQDTADEAVKSPW
ncbi:MAG: STAS domain-containing protein [Thermoguttaceae bacterium]